MNLLSIPMLENAGYKVSTHTDRDWEVITPKEDVVTFKRDTGICKVMPYGFSKKEIEHAELSHVVQRQIGHPIDEHLKQIVSQRCLKNTPIRSSDVANAKVMFGPSVAGLKEWTNRKKTREFTVDRVLILESY